MGNGRIRVLFAGLVALLGTMGFGGVARAAAPAADPLDQYCPEAFKGPGCKNYLAVNPVPAALCSMLCTASESTIDTAGKCPIVPAVLPDATTSPPTVGHPAFDKVSPNGCVVSDKVWWHSGGGAAVVMCTDKDKDGVPDKWLPSCATDKKHPEYAKYKADHPAFDHDNCVDVANGPNQAGIPGVKDQLDTDGDDRGDACDYATKSELDEALARMNAALDAIGASDDERKGVLADVKQAYDNGGLVGRNELREGLMQTNSAVVCLQTGKVPVFNANGSVSCEEDPWRTAKDQLDKDQTVAIIKATENRPAGEIGAVALGAFSSDGFGTGAAQGGLTLRPNNGLAIRLGVLVGLPLGVRDEDGAKFVVGGYLQYQATQAFGHGNSCDVGIAAKGLLMSAVDGSFHAQATAAGGMAEVPFTCGRFVITPSIGPGYVKTTEASGLAPIGGLSITGMLD